MKNKLPWDKPTSHSIETKFQFRGKPPGIKPFGGANKKIGFWKYILLVFLANFILDVVIDWDNNVKAFQKGMHKADTTINIKRNSE